MTKNTAKDLPFGKGLEELEGIAAWFESDGVDLDEGVAKFERGLVLVQQLRTQLTAVENRVEKIRADFSAGVPAETEPEAEPEPDPVSEPFGDTGEAADEADGASPALFDL